jgi:hypothetical protein
MLLMLRPALALALALVRGLKSGDPVGVPSLRSRAAAALRLTLAVLETLLPRRMRSDSGRSAVPSKSRCGVDERDDCRLRLCVWVWVCFSESDARCDEEPPPPPCK